MRGTCNILVRRKGGGHLIHGIEMGECGKPSVYSHPCSCDRCDIEPGYHLPSHRCAEHYDQLMKRHKRD